MATNNPEPEPVPEPILRFETLTDGPRVYVWVTGSPCFVVEWCADVNFPNGPWHQQGGVISTTQPVEIEPGDGRRIWWARAVPCEETEQPE